jgi:hypothetical protein
MPRYRWTRDLYRSALCLVAGVLSALGGCGGPRLAFGQEAQAPAFANKVAGLELPAPVEIDYRPGKLVRVATKAEGKVSFLVKTSPAVELDTTSDGKTLSFPMPPPGTEVLVVAAVNGQGAPAIAETLIVVKGGDAPRPPPGPDPKPSAGGARHATLVLDYDRLTTLLADLKDDAPLRKAAAELGVSFRVLNVNAQAAQDRGFAELYRKAGGPCLVIQSATPGKAGVLAVYSVQPSRDKATNEKALLDLVKKHR